MRVNPVLWSIALEKPLAGYMVFFPVLIHQLTSCTHKLVPYIEDLLGCSIEAIVVVSSW